MQIPSPLLQSLRLSTSLLLWTSACTSAPVQNEAAALKEQQSCTPSKCEEVQEGAKFGCKQYYKEEKGETCAPYTFWMVRGSKLYSCTEGITCSEVD